MPVTDIATRRGDRRRRAARQLDHACTLRFTNKELIWLAGNSFHGEARMFAPEASGRPAVKLSDNPAKASGDPAEIGRYLRMFGREGLASQPLSV